ncbi:hypothetical protein [Bacteroides sp.]|uniref:hypothetical protein n=1 Tax=Bacteroides sp. TaxID=29523 RepID=UPI0025BAFD94|nr:hypothetical protein [Bacteroides sp.]
MKNIFIFFVAVCTMYFCSPSLYAQKEGESTMASLTHRNWIWQCDKYSFVYIHFDRKIVMSALYARSSSRFLNTHFPNEYKCIRSEVYPYHLSDSIPSLIAFEYEKVGNIKRGRYWLTPVGGLIVPSVMEIVKVTKDSLIVKDNRSENKILFKRIKRKEFNKLINKKHRIQKK